MNGWKSRVIWSSIIALAAILAYLPSIKIVSRADNEAWFLDTACISSFPELITQFYSYNRVRQTCPGDMLMFRPGVFLDLSLRSWIFGPENPELWQVYSLGMHVLMSLVLLALLSQIWPAGAGYCALLFAVLSAGRFMVHYSHVSSFMLALALVHLANLLVWRYEAGSARSNRSVVLIVLCLTAATFILEVFSPFSIFILIYFIVLERRAKPNAGIMEIVRQKPVLPLLIMPPLLFAIANVTDFMVRHSYIQAHASEDAMSRDVWKTLNPSSTIHYMITLPADWIYQGIFLSEDHLLVRSSLCSGIADIILILVMTGVIIFCTRRPRECQFLGSLNQHAFAILMGAMIGFVLLVYVIFRVNPRGGHYSASIAIYPYVFWSFLLVVVCYAAQRAGLRVSALAACVLILLAVLNAIHTFGCVQSLAEVCKREYTFISESRGFVRMHCNEPNFSIARLEMPYLFCKYVSAEPAYILVSDHDGHLIVKRNQHR